MTCIFIVPYFYQLPPDQRFLMNTTCPNNACIGNFISKVGNTEITFLFKLTVFTCSSNKKLMNKLIIFQLQDDFPGCTVSMNLSTSKAPTLEVVPNDILGHFEGDFVFYVNFPNKTTKYIFTSHVVCLQMSSIPKFIRISGRIIYFLFS